jgi:hypothetical protein
MAGEAQLRTQCRAWRQVYSGRRFGILLVLTVLLAGSPVLFGFGLSAGLFDGLMALVSMLVAKDQPTPEAR